MKRAVLYARVSGDDRDREGRNLVGQLDMCRVYAQRKGWLKMAELAEDDRGASGASLDLPQLNRALDMARAGEYDILITRELDRLARGRRLKVKGGSLLLHGTPAPYGYRAVEKDGREILEIKEKRAEVIRLIFQWYS